MFDEKELPKGCDKLCPYRSCFQLGENKGTFVQGRGYTHYYDKPIPVCMTNHLHGRPIKNGIRPAPDLEFLIKDIDEIVRQMKCTQKVKHNVYWIRSILVSVLYDLRKVTKDGNDTN